MPSKQSFQGPLGSPQWGECDMTSDFDMTLRYRQGDFKVVKGERR